MNRAAVVQARELRGRRRRRLPRLVAVVTTALMTIGLVSIASPAMAATHDVATIDQLASAMAAAASGDVIRVTDDIAGDVTSPDVAVPTGVDVTLDLNGHNVTVHGSTVPNFYDPGNEPGIWVPASSALTIAATGGGSLHATGTGYSAGIGGAAGNIDSGSITILGGNITAIGTIHGAGIGGAYNGSGGHITIAGGNIYAESLSAGSGIGSGANGDDVTIEITGGVIEAISHGRAGIGGSGTVNVTICNAEVTAISTSTGAGIGTGYFDDALGSQVTIHSGTVIAQGGSRGAGIGAGAYSSGIAVTITGGTVTATGGEGGAGIGGGQRTNGEIGGGAYGGDGGVIAITGGTVTATGGLGAAGLGGGAASYIGLDFPDPPYGGAGAQLTIGAGADVTAATTPGAWITQVGPAIGAGGNFALWPWTDLENADFGSLSNAGVLRIPAGNEVPIPDDETVLNTGTIINHGVILNPNNVTHHNTVVNFDGAGGAPDVASARVFAASFADAEMALPGATRDGHTFLGWFTAGDGSGTEITAGFALGAGGPKSMTAHAYWLPHSYTVAFDSAGGSAVAPVAVDHGDSVAAPADPTRDGYGFTGWFTDEGGSVPYDFSTPVVGDLVLYAGWSLNSYTVAFESAGGSAVAPVAVDHGDAVAAPADPTRVGYSFTGWFADVDATVPYDFSSPVLGDLALYAGWLINTYTVTFDSAGGSAVAPVAVDHGDVLAVPADPNRNGYTFTGWFTDASTTALYDFSLPVTSDLTLYAGWVLNTYTVAFDSGGGTLVAPVTVDHGQPVTEPAAPLRVGYSFTGWFTDAEATAAYDFASPVTGDLTLYAAWSINTYTVSFDSAGGSAVTPVNIDHGDVVVAPGDPTREGYGFTGWFTDEGGSVPYDFSTPVVGDLVLYAGWSLNSYTVAFESAGGSAVAPVAVDHGDAVAAPADPTRVGYSFTGWFADADATVPYDFASPVTGDFTLYAGWLINTYTVTFDSAGGSAVSPVAVDHGDVLAAPVDPNRIGYTFTGWFTEVSATAPYDFSSPVTDDLRLYAGWVLNTYTVTFDSGGGTLVASVTVDHGQPVTEPAAPLRVGYSFTGWFADDDATVPYDFASPVTGDFTLNAGWLINTYTVTFDSAGGSAVASASVDHGEVVAVPAEPTRVGYGFTGWFVDAEATAAYNFSAPVTGDLTLYAGWVINTYTVTFDSAGGSAVVPVSVDYGDSVAAPADPERVGCTFTGWFVNAEATVPYDFSSPVVGDLTLYAGWSINTYIVVFDSDGGSAVTDVTVVHGEVLPEPADPTREGYAFTGWFADAELTLLYDFTEPVTGGDITLYAGWSANPPPTPPTPPTPPVPPAPPADGGLPTTGGDSGAGALAIGAMIVFAGAGLMLIRHQLRRKR